MITSEWFDRHRRVDLQLRRIVPQASGSFSDSDWKLPVLLGHVSGYYKKLMKSNNGHQSHQLAFFISFVLQCQWLPTLDPVFAVDKVSKVDVNTFPNDEGVARMTERVERVEEKVSIGTGAIYHTLFY